MVVQLIVLRLEQLLDAQLDLRLQCLQAGDACAQVDLIQLLVVAARDRLVPELVKRHAEVLEFGILQQPARLCHADTFVLCIPSVEPGQLLIQFTQDSLVLARNILIQFLIRLHLLLSLPDCTAAPVGAAHFTRRCRHRPDHRRSGRLHSAQGIGTAAAPGPLPSFPS